jgi:hypothetical protein
MESADHFHRNQWVTLTGIRTRFRKFIPECVKLTHVTQISMKQDGTWEYEGRNRLTSPDLSSWPSQRGKSHQGGISRLDRPEKAGSTSQV